MKRLSKSSPISEERRSGAAERSRDPGKTLRRHLWDPRRAKEELRLEQKAGHEQKFKKFQDSQDHMLLKFQGKIGENVEMIQPRDVALPSSVFCIRPILEDGSHTGSDFVLDFLSPYVESRVVGALAEEQSKQRESMSL